MRKLLAVVILLLAVTSCTQEDVTYVKLVQRLTDLEHLAVLPAPGETCAQWSSYDRRSRFDEATGLYVNWDANGDGGGVIRKEDNGQLVFAEMEGPGVIWRIWSAQAGKGHVKIFLDGATEPAVDLPFEGYFDCKNKPFTYPALVHTAAKGLNNYVPIPYQKSCKIVAENDWGKYYHFTYATYPKGTILPTFKRDLSPADLDALAKANDILTRCGSDPAGERPGATTETKTITAAPKATTTVAKLAGPRAITALKVKIDLPESPDDRDPLRELALQISWDGEKEPSVWAPLGDFFGTAPGVNHYKSLPMGMTEDGFYSYWYMPFAESALIELVNDGKSEHKVNLEITVAPLSHPVKQLGRFHAKWHRNADLDPKRTIDWTMLKTEGRGRFCGVMLHVWNPRGSWWGEGDEKFFIDGERFPSTFGTGSEDYFGYAWCNPTLFENCYHNQTISMGNRGHVSVNRWHITDNVPFQTSFEGAIEKYFPDTRPTLYACTAYWYLAAGGADHYKPVPVNERIGYWLPLPTVKGRVEGEDMRILVKPSGTANCQMLNGFGTGWSLDAHLWWRGGKPGDVLELGIPVKEAGKYHVKTQLTKAGDYGIVQLSLNGKMLGGPIDLYNNGVIPTGELDMGVHDLTQGLNRLQVEIVGANEKAKKAYMFGIDYVQLDEVK
ncbi:MAG: glycoside hydrolase family 172 protein [Planctomycetota bacterium]